VNKTQQGQAMPPVRIYTTPYCPFCIAAKRMLKKKGASFEEIDVTDPAKREKMTALADGRTTVPQIFIGERHIGGFDDLSELNDEGQLDKLLAG
jgi:glutaredoxin 3